MKCAELRAWRQAKISHERMIVAAFNTGPVVDLAVTKEPAAK